MSLLTARGVIGTALGILLPCSGWADWLSFQSIGANFPFMLRSEQGIFYRGLDIDGTSFTSSSPLSVPVTYNGANVYFQTGPLAEQTDLTWIFQGNSLSTVPGIDGGGLTLGVPTGYATCEAAGLHTFGGYCLLSATINGSSSGETTLTLGNPVAFEYYGVDYLGWRLTLTGPVSFGLSADLSLALGITTAPYVGTFTLTGTFNDPASLGPLGILDGNCDCWFRNDSIELTGTTVPEPSAFALLLTMLGCTAVVLHRLRPTSKRTR